VIKICQTDLHMLLGISIQRLKFINIYGSMCIAITLRSLSLSLSLSYIYIGVQVKPQSFHPHNIVLNCSKQAIAYVYATSNKLGNIRVM
jgi:hypothetical protein